MILLYAALVAVLAVARLVAKWRASSLLKRYLRVASQTENLVKEAGFRPGNGSPDRAKEAGVQYELGQLVQKRDRVETRYERWQRRADRLARWINGIRGWRGKKLPYIFGVIDVAMTVALLNWLGIGQYIDARVVCDWGRSWWFAK